MKKVLLVLALFSLFATGLFASAARIDGMGLGAAAWMVQDQYLAYKYFPQMVSEYNNSAVVEASNNTYGYVDLSCLNGVVGIIANSPSASVIAPAVNSSGAIYSMGNLGFGITYGSTNLENLTGAITGNSEGTYTSSHAYNIGLDAGYTMDLKKNMPLNIGLNINIPSNYSQDNETKTNGVTTAINKNGTTGVEANLDGRLALQNDMLANVNIGLVQSNNLIFAEGFTAAGVLNAHTEEATNSTTFNLQLGGSKTVKVGTVDLFVGAQPSLSMINSLESNKDIFNNAILAGNGNKSSETTVSLPIFAGVEGKVNDTWVVRGGVNKAIWTVDSLTTVTKLANGNTATNNTINTTTSGSPAVSLGITGVFGDVTIDGDVSTGILMNGPYFITGNQSNPFISQVALTYAWK
ncbi:MAG: hypothetical protein ABSA34_00430 [Candidatus Goldiibacteriota bacterium]|jgi:hypothetical protein